MFEEKSQFWSYKIYNSRRQKRQNGAAQTGFCGPFYFEQPVNLLEVKKWIREHLGLDDTSHIEARISESEHNNKRAYSVWKKSMNRELQSQWKGKARPGNLVVKWLKPEIA